MRVIFEELAARELDGLYAGALFLTAGDAGAAERLLTSTLVDAASVYFGPMAARDPCRWLDGRLITEFLATQPRLADGLRAPAPLLASTPPAPRGWLPHMDTPAFCRLAEALPPVARAAVWLVALRRWHYDDAATMVGVTRDELVELLRYRDVLLAALVTPTAHRAGGNVAP